MKGSMNYTQTKQKTPDGISYSIVAAGKEDLHIRQGIQGMLLEYDETISVIAFSSCAFRLSSPTCLFQQRLEAVPDTLLPWHGLQ